MNLHVRLTFHAEYTRRIDVTNVLLTKNITNHTIIIICQKPLLAVAPGISVTENLSYS